MVVSRAANTTTMPAISPSAGVGAWLLLWQDDGPGLGADVRGRGVATDGAWWGWDLLVAQAVGVQGAPSLASNGINGYLAVWQDTRRGGGATPPADIYARWLDGEGRPAGAEWVLCRRAGDQCLPVVAHNSTDGSYLVVWQDAIGGSYDLYSGQVAP